MRIKFDNLDQSKLVMVQFRIGYVIFELRFIWIHAYSPFNVMNILLPDDHV